MANDATVKKGINALGAKAAYNLANVTKTKPQYGALTPKWLTKFLEFKGLETGIFKGLIPDMDIITYGPIAEGEHTPDEKLDLASFDRFKCYHIGDFGQTGHDTFTIGISEAALYIVFDIKVLVKFAEIGTVLSHDIQSVVEFAVIFLHTYHSFLL